MALVCGLAKSRKMKWIIYIILALGAGIYCYYDGFVSEKYLKDLSNLWFNRVGSIVLAVAFVVLVIGFFVILKTRIAADDDGIDVNGKSKIPWKDIVRIDDGNVEKGLVDIFYTVEGQEEKWTADSYKIDRFDELLDMISRHRPDLLPPIE